MGKEKLTVMVNRLVVLYPLPGYRPMPFIVNGIYGQCYNFLASDCTCFSPHSQLHPAKTTV